MTAPAIPIESIYYLLVYAWDALDEKDVVEVGDLGPHSHTLELLAGVLANGVAHVLRRGLDRGYVEESTVLAGVRGKLDISASVKRALLPQGRAVCVVDELSYDVPHNQIVRAVLRLLARHQSINPELRGRVADLYRRFEGVSDIPLTTSAFRRVQLHRNTRYYTLLMNVCRLIAENTLVDEQTGLPLFRDFVRDEHRMRRLFERFVRTFYRRHAHGYRVRSVWLPWQQIEGATEDQQFLPSLKTDIVLQSPNRSIVMDTKFKARTLAESRGGGRHIHTSNLYQIYAYMRNMSLMPDFPADIEGMLLYPQVDAPVHVDLVIQGHRMQVRTVNLNQHWTGIRAELMQILAA